MTEYRVAGTVAGSDGSVRVMTEWLNENRGKVTGIMIGLEARGWNDCEIEQREVQE